MKLCKNCGVEKPLDNFFREKQNKTDGRNSLCKVCKTAKTIEWRKSNRKAYNAGMRAYNKIHYARLRLQRYKLSQQDYDAMLSKQNGKCALCAKGPSGKRPLAIDHHHDTGKVRGLLCYGCNRAIAILDQPQLLKLAQEYLKS